MARARIYIRRSDDDQSTYSPEAQERQNCMYCELHNHEVVGIYIDDDLSGTKESRAEFQRLLADARNDPGSIVVVNKIDRLARDAELVLRTIKEFDRRGITLVSVMEQIDFSSPIGRVMLTNLAAFAEYYSRNLSTEVKKGLTEKARQGGFIGLPPLGYTTVYEYDSKGERIRGSDRLIFSEDAETPRLAFRLYATGAYSDMTIAQELNERGLTMLDPKTGERRPFQKDAIRNMLTNSAYIGVVRCGGKAYPGAHEPLIDQQLWDIVQSIRGRRSALRGGTIAVRGAGGLLSELGYCARCGAKLHWYVSGAGLYYYCSRRRKYGTSACGLEMVPANKIEPAALDILRSLSLDTSTIERVIAEVQRRLATPTKPKAVDTARVREQIRRLKLSWRAGDEDLDERTYFTELKRLEALLLDAPPSPPTKTLDVGKAIAMLSSIPTLLETADRQQQQALLHQVLQKVWIDRAPKRRGDAWVKAITPTEPFAEPVSAIISASKFARAISTGLQPC
jgi:DNA invertase Pin-like site-specific DNA recombinase